MTNFTHTFLSCPKAIPLALAVISAAALGMALISQYQFGLQPCNLCIIQRYPYGIIIALSIIGFLVSFKNKKATAGILSIIGLTFLANSIIAFYHSGVERKWWKSALEGCNVPDMKGNITDIIADIQSRAEAVRCDEIPWADPILGLSMANYNVIFCLGLGIIALISARQILKASL